MVGKTISHYEITEKLGQGGMGVVWKAQDTQLGRDVALKVLPADAVTDSTARARLLREARTASKLNHPHICTIYEVGESDGLVYIAMELVEGQTLSARLAAGALPVEEVLRFGLQLADALVHAHKRGIVHRDLKSANVVLTPETRVKVLDFGLAKRLKAEIGEDATTLTQQDTITAAGAVAGTPAYMSPEQLRGQPADARSDIWALGVMLYEMASGVRPFQGKTGFELSSAILNQPPAPLPGGPGGPPPAWLRSVIGRCLEKDPGRRYQSSIEVRAALEDVQAGVTLKVWLTWKYGLSRRRWLAVAATVMAIVAVLAGLEVGGVRNRLLGVFAGQKYRSLAVLPVANLTGDPQQEYFADGMTDSLIANVSKVGVLRVISRTSAMRYKGAKKSLAEIARELKVDTVLEASVAREAGRVRLTAQLIEAATDQHLWTETYERELTSILGVQSEVARAVARTVRARLTPEQERRLRSARQVNPQVYEAYLRGKFYVSQNTPESFEKGMKYLQQAVEIDPAEPLAYIGVAEGYISLGHGGAERPDAFPRAGAAAEQALKLDPDLAEAVGVLADVALYYEWDWGKAENLLKRALEMNPSRAGIHYHYAWYLALFDRLDEAIAEHKLARDLDPLGAPNTAWLGGLYNYARRYDEAIVEAKKALELNPKYWPSYRVLCFAYSRKGMHQEAIAAAQRLVELAPAVGNAALGTAYALAGQREQALAVAAKLKQGSPGRHLRVAEFFAALGDTDAAMRELEAAYQARVSGVPWIRVHGGAWDDLRDDPRFQQLVRRMNLPL